MCKLSKLLAKSYVRPIVMAWALVFGFLGVAASAWATDPITLPTTGVDLPGLITAAITAMGGIVSVVVGGFFAFLVIRKGLTWARGALRG
jgi:hypothetical protein